MKSILVIVVLALDLISGEGNSTVESFLDQKNVTISGISEEPSRDARLYRNRLGINRLGINRLGINRLDNPYQTLSLNAECTTESNEKGICQRNSDCVKGGGTPSGICYPVGVCCYNSMRCGEATTAKQVFLQGNSANGLTNDCVYTIIPYSLQVCQLKVNFDIQLLNPTPKLDPLEGDPRLMPDCVDAFLQIGPHKFCGSSLDQHIYVPFSASNLANNEIIIHQSNAVTPAFWKLSVTQIECPTDQPLGHNLRSTASVQEQNLIKLQNLANSGKFGGLTPWKLAHRVGRLAGTGLHQLNNVDVRLIAPRGCLQYFTEERGVIRSFNYNDGYGPYMPDMQYAICIRRPPLAEGLRLTFDAELNSNGLLKDIDRDCVESTPGEMESNDYITVPFSLHPDYPESTRYCGRSLQLNDPPVNNNILEVKADVPFIIYFSSGKYYNPTLPVTPRIKRAFKITYQVLK